MELVAARARVQRRVLRPAGAAVAVHRALGLRGVVGADHAGPAVAAPAER